MLGTLRKFAEWYMNLRPALRAVLFLTIVVGPLILYAYLATPTPNELIPTTRSTAPPYPSISCMDLLGDEILVYGTVYLGGDCYAVNSTHYFYLRGREAVLVLDLSGGSGYKLIFTIPHTGAIAGYNYTEATVILPPTPPETLPEWVADHVCKYPIGNTTSPYEAWRDGVLPLGYNSVCSS